MFTLFKDVIASQLEADVFFNVHLKLDMLNYVLFSTTSTASQIPDLSSNKGVSRDPQHSIPCIWN